MTFFVNVIQGHEHFLTHEDAKVKNGNVMPLLNQASVLTPESLRNVFKLLTSITETLSYEMVTSFLITPSSSMIAS